jgi:hypothetical protein
MREVAGSTPGLDLVVRTVIFNRLIPRENGDKINALYFKVEGFQVCLINVGKDIETTGEILKKISSVSRGPEK